MRDDPKDPDDEVEPAVILPIWSPEAGLRCVLFVQPPLNAGVDLLQARWLAGLCSSIGVRIAACVS
jgi:hypothetical protein